MSNLLSLFEDIKRMNESSSKLSQIHKKIHDNNLCLSSQPLHQFPRMIDDVKYLNLEDLLKAKSETNEILSKKEVQSDAVRECTEKEVQSDTAGKCTEKEVQHTTLQEQKAKGKAFIAEGMRLLRAAKKVETDEKFKAIEALYLREYRETGISKNQFAKKYANKAPFYLSEVTLRKKYLQKVKVK